jgi:hypothetical protein
VLQLQAALLQGKAGRFRIAEPTVFTFTQRHNDGLQARPLRGPEMSIRWVTFGANERQDQ